MKRLAVFICLFIINITFAQANTITVPVCEWEYDEFIDALSLPERDNLVYATRVWNKYKVTNVKNQTEKLYYRFNGFYSNLNRSSFAYKILGDWGEVLIKDDQIIGSDTLNIEKWNIIYSDDWESISYQEYNSKTFEKSLFDNGNEILSSDEYISEGIYSTDGGSFSYIAIDDSANSKWKKYAFKDGERIWKWYQDISWMIYSQEGNVLNYKGWIRWKQVLVRDWDEISDTFDSINWLQYSSDWKSYYFTWKQNSKIFHIKDGEKISWEGVQGFQFLPNSQSYVYIKSLANWKKVIVKDEVQITDEQNGFSGLTFSPDWKSFSYFKEVGGKYILVKDGVELWKRYLRVQNIHYANDGSLYYLAANSYHSKTRDTKKVMVRDGVELIPEYLNNTEYPVYNYIDRVIYSPDGKGFMYQMDMGDEWLLIKDNKEILKSEYGLAHLEYSPTGESYYYTIHSLDGRTLVRDGVELGKYKNIKDIEYWSGDKLTFLSDNVLYSDYCEKEEIIETEKDSSNVISDENNIGNDLDDSDDVRVIDPKVESKIMNFVTKLESSLNGDIEKLNNKLHGLIQALEEYSIKHPKYELLIKDIIYLLDKKISESE